MTTPTMRAYLDDEPLDLEGQTLAAAVVAGRRAADARGRMIIEVWADGEQTPAAHLEEPPPHEPYAGEVRFVSADPGALVAHALEEAGENVAGVRESQTTAATQLARGETGDAMGNVGSAVRAWESVLRAVQDGCAALGAEPWDLLGPTGDRGSCEQAITQLLEALREVQRSITDQDVASLADVLEYDLNELADTWAELLGAMSRGATQRASAE